MLRSSTRLAHTRGSSRKFRRGLHQRKKRYERERLLRSQFSTGYIMITGASHDSSEVTGTNTYGVFGEHRHFSTARDFSKSIFKHSIRGATSNDPLGAEIQFREVRSGWSRQPQLPIRHRGLYRFFAVDHPRLYPVVFAGCVP